MPDERPSLAKVLMDYGAAMQRMGDVSDEVNDSVERFRFLLENAIRGRDSLEEKQVVQITLATTRAVDDYTKRTRAYCAALEEICDQYEKGQND